MTPMPPPRSRRSGFTLVELLLALTLGTLAAIVLAMLLRAVLTADHAQAERLQGPRRARAVLRSLGRELSCAYAPALPDDAPPFTLATSTELGKPRLVLQCYAPVVLAPAPYPDAYDIHQVTYLLHDRGKGRAELQRVAAPCSGPGANAPVTNTLLAGPFTLEIAALTNQQAHAEWPPPAATNALLPQALHFTLRWQNQPEPFQLETLIHAAHSVPSPRHREIPTP